MAVNRWIERLARFGYAAKGVVYFIIGLLAMQVAFGAGSKTTDTSGVLQTIVTQPLGKFLLSVLAVGLIAYVFWRFTQAFIDPEHQDTDAKRVVQRLGYALSGLSYLGLALSAVQIIVGLGGNNSSWRQDWTARLLAQPFGQWLVGIVGVIVIGVGLSHVYKAYTAKFRERFKLVQMSNAQVKWATRIGRFGIAARGIAFGVIGLLLIQAALQSDPDEARGLSGALQVLAEEPLGQWILGAIAVGLVAYAIHMLVIARYRRIVTPSI
jgi:hypothetical protein